MATAAAWKLLPITPRAAGLGAGYVATPEYAQQLLRFAAYASNFLEKSQTDVYVKCQASDERAMFRIVDGAWKFIGLAAQPGHEPAKVDEAATQFEFHALLLKRKEAELKETVTKPAVIRRGAKNRLVERTIDPAPGNPETVPAKPETAVEQVAKALPGREDLHNYVINDGTNSHTLPLRPSKIEEIADRLVDAIVNRALRRPMPDPAPVEPAPEPRETPRAPGQDAPAEATILVYKTVEVDTLVLLVLALFKHVSETGKSGVFDIRDLVNMMATGDAASQVKLVYNSPAYIRFRDHAHEYIERATAAIEKATGKKLHTFSASIEVAKDAIGNPIKRKLKHFELRHKNWKA